MAKNKFSPKKVKDEVVGVEVETTDNASEQEETTIQEDAPKKAAKVVEASAERMIRCRGIVDHKCTVGHTTYIVEKGRERSYPISVSMLLSSAQKVIQIG